MKNIAVIGAGTMGNGIAHVFAQYGFTVTLIDVSELQLNKALQTIEKNLDRMVSKGTITEEQKKTTIANISTSSNLESGVKNAELAIEAASENIDIKLAIFKSLDQFTNENCVLASNTSSISIAKIAAVTNRKEKVIGMHFMNPVPVMKLVEITAHPGTNKTVTDLIVQLSKQLNKVPCVVNDFPGFISNRILMPMINEAIYSLHEGVAGVNEIDTIMKLGMAHPMGPLQLADLIGLDVCLSIMNVLFDGFKNDKYTPCPLLVEMVKAGTLGAKSGEGFYTYTPGSKDLVVSRRFSN